MGLETKKLHKKQKLFTKFQDLKKVYWECQKCSKWKWSLILFFISLLVLIFSVKLSQILHKTKEKSRGKSAMKTAKWITQFYIFIHEGENLGTHVSAGSSKVSSSKSMKEPDKDELLLFACKLSTLIYECNESDPIKSLLKVKEVKLNEWAFRLSVSCRVIVDELLPFFAYAAEAMRALPSCNYIYCYCNAILNCRKYKRLKKFFAIFFCREKEKY